MEINLKREFNSRNCIGSLVFLENPPRLPHGKSHRGATTCLRRRRMNAISTLCKFAAVSFTSSRIELQSRLEAEVVGLWRLAGKRVGSRRLDRVRYVAFDTISHSVFSVSRHVFSRNNGERRRTKQEFKRCHLMPTEFCPVKCFIIKRSKGKK